MRPQTRTTARRKERHGRGALAFLCCVQTKNGRQMTADTSIRTHAGRRPRGRTGTKSRGRARRLIPGVLVLSLVMILGSSLTMLAAPAKASGGSSLTPLSIPTFTGWTGYMGSRALYPTLDQNVTPISSASNSSFSYQTSSNTSLSPIANSALVTLATTGSNYSWYSYQPGGIGSGWILPSVLHGVRCIDGVHARSGPILVR